MLKRCLRHTRWSMRVQCMRKAMHRDAPASGRWHGKHDYLYDLVQQATRQRHPATGCSFKPELLLVT